MAIIPHETIEQILDATDIVDLIQGYFPLKRAGANFQAICPFHNEKTPSFNISPQRQTFHCFGCQAGGDAIKFVMMYDNLPFPEAARKLADRAGVMIREEEIDPKEEAKIRGKKELLRLQRSAADFFHRMLFKSPVAQPGRDYLKSRGLTMDISRNWKFGYAPNDQRQFFDWARRENFSMQQLVDGGLAKWRDENNPNRGAYAFFRHRLMFPVNNDFGEPIAFSGRVLSKDQPGGKYVNSPETILFNKSKTFFGLDKSKRAIYREKRCIVFEGQLDMLVAFENGIENAVAPLGTAFTDEHARILKRHTEEVVLCYDSDTAGLNAASKTFRILAPSGMLIRLAQLPPGEDPDSLIRSQGIDALKTILANAPEFFDFQIDQRGSRLNDGTLRDRLNFAKILAADIALVGDKMVQDSLISRITTRLGVGDEDVRKEVRNAAAAIQRQEKNRNRRQAIANRRQAEQTPNGYEEQQNGSPAAAPTEITVRAIRDLSRALLAESETRRHIVANPVPSYFDDLMETELLSKIWNAKIDPDSPASVNSFIASLSEPEQKLVRNLLNEQSSHITPEIAEQCLARLRRDSIKTRIQVVKAKLAPENLPPEERTRLTKLLLDLREHLHDS